MRYWIIALIFCFIAHASCHNLTLSWEVKITPKTLHVRVDTLHVFDNLVVDACVESISTNHSRDNFFVWHLFPNCTQDQTLSVSTILEIPTLRDSEVPITLGAQSMMVTAQAIGETTATVSLSLPARFQDEIMRISWQRDRQNLTLSKQIDRYYTSTNAIAIRPRVRLMDRRHQSPLSSQLVCQSDAAELSIWTITNKDVSTPHSILTIDGEPWVVPPASTIQVIIHQVGPFVVRQSIATWIGDKRWGDGLITDKTTILPSVAPTAKISCMCGINVDCKVEHNQQRVDTVHMLVTRKELAARKTKAWSQFMFQAKSNLFSNTSEMTTVNSLFILVGLILFGIGLFIYIRNGSDILPDTNDTRQFKQDVGVDHPGTQDETLREQERELAYARQQASKRRQAATAVESSTSNPNDVIVPMTSTTSIKSSRKKTVVDNY